MKKFTLSLAVLATLVLLSADTGVAQAAHGFRGFRGFGIHLGGRNVHVDIGRPHGYRTFGGSFQSGFGVPSRHVWHNTSHFDYHPTERVWHGNHIDVIPGHFDYHNTGHWDRRFGGHH